MEAKKYQVWFFFRFSKLRWVDHRFSITKMSNQFKIKVSYLLIRGIKKTWRKSDIIGTTWKKIEKLFTGQTETVYEDIEGHIRPDHENKNLY